MTQRELAVSLGKKEDFAVIDRTWRGTFAQLVERLLKNVKDADDKATPGWVCGAAFEPEYRHSSNFKERNLLSLDYDHIKPEDVERVLKLARGSAYLAYTTWSHTPDHPRLRLWIPLSRPASFEEFQAVSRAVAARADIELAARESHTPAQFMYRPASRAQIAFESWQDATAPYLDVDGVLNEYQDWKDRSTWPHRKDGDSCHEPGDSGSALDKPGIIGEFNRAFSISAAIDRFGLPYTSGSSEGRWTYTAGSRADGAVSYDDDTKLHSYHDTDPARGQHNAYDLVRLHLFGKFDEFDGPDIPIADRDSSRRMAKFAAEQPEIAAADFSSLAFRDLTDKYESMGKPESNAESVGAPDKPNPALPATIPQSSTRDSDQENARRIQQQYGKEIISIAKAFYVWTGTHWAQNDSVVARHIATLSATVHQEAARLYAADNDSAEAARLFKWAGQCGSAGTMAACEKLLQKLLRFEADALNRDRALLNCRNGTVDLRTGEMRPHSQADFITACAPVDYVNGAQAPRFERFLREIFKGDEKVIAFAQRWFGYCITGETREHAIVFHIGEGGNGKGKLIEVLQHVLGPDYAFNGPRTLLAPGGTGASPETASLLGKRMVTLNETNRDEEFNEGVLKNLTGGDRLTARNLFKDYFQFDPTHKLQIFTNNEPRITGVDRGLWRRIFMLRFRVKYGRDYEIAKGLAQEIQDDELSAKLAAESEGILSWLVAGARTWYACGLMPPDSVLEDTEAFRAKQDHTGQFIAERTARRADATVAASNSTGSLYVAYAGWMKDMGYRPLGRNRFMDDMKRAAPWAVYRTELRQYKGIELKKDDL
jgi:P4 family phage/plasmid primase-like protien